MNIRNVLRTYSLLRQLSDDETALLEVLRGMNEGERESLIVALQPEKPATKKVGRKSSKSSRASGIHAQLKERRGQRGTPDDSDDDNRFDGKSAQETRRELLQDIDDEDSYCTHQYEHDGIMIECGEPADQNIHHLSTTEGYHPFVSESGAPPAPASSPANGGAESGAVSSEIAKDAASSVHHAGG